MSKGYRNFLTLMILTTFIFLGMTGNAFAADSYVRIGGNERYDTSVLISQQGWPNGSQNMILTTGENFSDALCAAPLAKQLNAPVLLTKTNQIEDNVVNEIKRLDAKNVYIIGGPNAVSNDIEKQLLKMGLNLKRLSGKDRYETAVEIANYMASTFNISNEVVLATGADFPDALSIAPIAGIKNMPILLTEKANLPEKVNEFIKNKNVVKTYVLGGNNVISDAVYNQLPGHIRLGGNDRYETNAIVLNFFISSINFNSAYLATGNDFPDALAGSALAANNSAPIVLIDKPPTKPTLDFVSDNRTLIKDMIVLGGTTVVPDSSIQPLLPKIIAADDIIAFSEEGQKYELPATVNVKMDNNTTKNVAVTWDNGTEDDSNGIVIRYKGTVKGYDGNVNLVLNIMHSIVGTSKLSAEQMAQYLLSKNPNPSINCTALELAKLFIEEGNAEGIRGDIAFAQSLKETNYFKFTGLAKPEWNNYCGLGVTGAVDPVSGEPLGSKFSTPREGVRAQIQHLKAYACTDPLKQDVVDPRFSLVKRGTAPYWEWLGKGENPNNVGWAVPGDNYGHSIISDYYLKIKNFIAK